MKRRHFLSSLTVIYTGTFLGTETLLSSCRSEMRAESFTEENVRLLDEIGEIIIPATASSPGAKAAKTGRFIQVYVTDCYPPAEQEIFLEGLASFKKRCREKYNTDFLNLENPQKRALLQALDKEAEDHAIARKNKKPIPPGGKAVQAGKPRPEDKIALKEKADHYFTMLRNLTLLGYFTSEPGATKALRYIQTPGYFAGDIPYKTGDKSWAG